MKVSVFAEKIKFSRKKAGFWRKKLFCGGIKPLFAKLHFERKKQA
jgi:hypothetical protein